MLSQMLTGSPRGLFPFSFSEPDECHLVQRPENETRSKCPGGYRDRSCLYNVLKHRFPVSWLACVLVTTYHEIIFIPKQIEEYDKGAGHFTLPWRLAYPVMVAVMSSSPGKTTTWTGASRRISAPGVTTQDW